MRETRSAIERGVRRQRAIQESRGFAGILCLALLAVASICLLSLIAAAEAGALISFNGFAGVVILVSSAWVAVHLFREVLRLGKLLKDPQRLMRPGRDPELVDGIQWSGLLPFSVWRN